ncbi:MAG: flagellar basal body protein FliL [Spirochaetaceae bacterium]|jgi:flagellar basal body-associated protein FliL|nr:flagellar basal body protein FliL [Spirochaetaceae bacterium]
MKKAQSVLHVVYRVLLVLAVLLGLCIVSGTVYAVLKGPGAPPGAAASSGDVPAGERVFTGIDRIRASTGGERPAAVILSVTFPYDPSDRFFVEELSARVGDFRRVSVEYFASLTSGDLTRLNEGEIKAELLRRYNAGLRLGRISVLYFNEFMILE